MIMISGISFFQLSLKLKASYYIIILGFNYRNKKWMKLLINSTQIAPYKKKTIPFFK
jgi:hypothetical protein